MLALVAGGFNLVYQLWPSLKADPGLQHSAQIAFLAMENNVAYSDYIKRPGVKPHDRPPADPSTTGNVFYVQIEMEGFKGKHAKLRWFTYNDDNGKRLPAFSLTGINQFEAKAPTTKSISEEWIEPPMDSGHYKIRFELYDGGDVLLAFADTKKFEIETA